MPPTRYALEVALGFARLRRRRVRSFVTALVSGVAVGPEVDMEPGERDVDLPRTQTGRQPQRLLLTIFGDYWIDRREHLPSAALVRLLQEFDVTAASARTALSRLSRRDLVVASRSGRRTAYGLSPRAARVLSEGAPRILGFGAHTATWDGRWTFFAFSVPEERRRVRPALRARLRWAGLAPLYDGLWVSPRKVEDQLAEIVRELDIDGCTVITGDVVELPQLASSPVAAWDLQTLRKRYEEFIAEFTPVLSRIHDGAVGAAEGLVIRTQAMYAWSEFPALDPELPDPLLPEDWPRRKARTLFTNIYDTLGPLAELRVKQIVSRFSPELASLVAHHTTDFGDGDSRPLGAS